MVLRIVKNLKILENFCGNIFLLYFKGNFRINFCKIINFNLKKKPKNLLMSPFNLLWCLAGPKHIRNENLKIASFKFSFTSYFL